jgi:hypothetical protein
VSETGNIICAIPVNSEKLFGIPYTPNNDSAQVPCEQCGLMCWIGVKQTKYKQESPDTPLMCAFCLAKKCKELNISANIKTLESE